MARPTTTHIGDSDLMIAIDVCGPTKFAANSVTPANVSRMRPEYDRSAPGTGEDVTGQLAAR